MSVYADFASETKRTPRKAIHRSELPAGHLLIAAYALAAAGIVLAINWPVIWTLVEPRATGDVLLHVLCMLLFPGLTLWLSYRARAGQTRNVQRLLSLASAQYGLLAIVILTGRLYFSRSLMFSSFGVAVVVGVAAIYLLRLMEGVERVAILQFEPTSQPVQLLGVAAQTVDDPGADLRQFDVLLLPEHGGVSPAWTQALSQASLAGVGIRYVSDFVEEARGRVVVDQFHANHVPQRGLIPYQRIKRCFDLAIVMLAAPVVLLLVCLASIAIFVLMGYPIFFTNVRVGTGGRTFRMYKLRTMTHRPEGGTAPTQHRDSRLTPLGIFLRRYRIDELPQFWNILRGDMSLVGPRPEQPGLAASYAQRAPNFAYRCTVPPGITGWAQINCGYAGDLSESMVKLSYDLFYIKYRSLGLDLYICLKTLWTLVSGQGAR